MPSYRSIRRMVGQAIRKNVVATINAASQNAGGIAAGTVTNFTILQSLPNPTANSSVPVSSRVAALYLDLTMSMDIANASPAAGAMAILKFIVWKNPRSGLSNPAGVSTAIVRTNALRPYIFMSAMQQQATQSAPPLHYVGWIKLPRRHQLMQENDALVVSLEGDVQAYGYNVMYMYKYR